MTKADDPQGAAVRWQRLEALYREIVAKPEGERAAALLSACPDDADLRAEVQALLDEPASAAGFLSSPALEVAGRLASKTSPSLTGRRIGVFEVRDLIGVGGMGEVYRAHDTKLGRDVAIKALPDAFARNAERLARFRREARVLASLNHPNIAAIHGVEEVDGRTFLILELVEGEDLAHRLTRGAIPLEQSIALALQIAEGLEEAHENGVVHRDLKPANIKVTPGGRVKILDFGLAKAYGPEEAEQGEVSNGPTRTRSTQPGLALGTPGYMSPEQVRGGPADKRSDIWALGVVLFEILTGSGLFIAATPSDMTAAILTADPDWSRLPADTPERVRTLLRRCLERDLKLRLRDIGEARIALAAPEAPAPHSKAAGSGPRVIDSMRRLAPWLALLALPLGLWMLTRPEAAGPKPPTPKTLLVDLGADASLSIGWGPAAVVSPNGETLVFVAEQAGVRRLFVRGLGQLRASPLPGTEDANHPFFAPHSRSVAFFANEKLKKIDVSGGPVTVLSDARRGRGGDWGEDDTIVFAPDVTGPLKKVPATGGAAEPIAGDAPEAGTRRWPQVLPGGKGVLHTIDVANNLTGFEDAEVVVTSAGSARPKVLVSNAYYGRCSPTGHLIFARKGRLFAVPFDIERLETVGEAVSILDSVEVNSGSGGAQLSFSSDGTLVYLPKRPQTSPLDWVTPEGVASKLGALESDWANPKFSPDGMKVAFDASDGRQRDIFVYDIKRGLQKQVTFDGSNDFLPVWSPDGRFLAFSSDRSDGGVANLYWMTADGTSEPERLTTSKEDEAMGSWHPSGKWLAYSSDTLSRRLDVKILPIERGPEGRLSAGEPVDFLSTQATEGRPMFSPDGRWIAYASDETGEVETFVRPFPKSGGKWRVSRHGGWFPRWASNPPRLMFTEYNSLRLLFAAYDGRGDSFEASEPALWSPTVHKGLGGFIPYDVHPDGRRVVMRVDPRESIDHVVLVSGFLDFLRKTVPGREGNRP